jgi:phage terminase large subunit-like protein
VQDTRLLAYIRSATNKDDWQDPATWAKANPSYGITIDEQDMRAAAEEATRKPALRAAFKRYRLNIWAEGGEDPWLNLALWDAAKVA